MSENLIRHFILIELVAEGHGEGNICRQTSVTEMVKVCWEGGGGCQGLAIVSLSDFGPNLRVRI